MKQANMTRTGLAFLSLALLGFAFALPAMAAELPIRKAGLWEMKMSRAGSNDAMPTMQQCTDEKTDKDMTTMFGSIQSMCSKYDMQNSGGKIVIESACSIGGGKTTSRAEFVGDFNSAYQVTVNSDTQGGPMPGKSTIVIDAKWLGSCTAGQKAGDIIMPNGMKMNINDLKKFQSMMPK